MAVSTPSVTIVGAGMSGPLLADIAIGRLVGIGPGRGVGLMVICLSIQVLLAVDFAFLNSRLRQLEAEVPDGTGPDHESDFSAAAPSNPSLRNI